jgi:polysaccharide export outer membrane protein
MFRTLTALVVAASLGLAGCAQHRPLPDLSHAEPEHGYRLASGDRLRIIVFGQENLSNSYALDGAGRLSFPLIGLVQAGGLSTPELERQLEARLRNGFLRDPKVAVEVEQYRPFFILGEVVQSGQYPFVNGATAQTAVAIAGGFTPRANRHVAEVTRLHNGELITGTLSLTDPIRPGDTIVIRERYF